MATEKLYLKDDILVLSFSSELLDQANAGDATSQFLLGGMYITGSGVTKDDAKAIEWYTKAAEQGHAEAQYYLSIILYGGDSHKDRVKAIEWCTSAAEQRHVEAQSFLGEMYYALNRAHQDYIKSYTWNSIACANGHDHARKLIESLSEIMTPEQILKAQAQAAAIFARIKSN